MSNIVPNSQTMYLYPVNIIESFIFEGRRYILTHSRALVSDYGKYGMLPPAGKGFYLEVPKGDFKKIKARYVEYQLQLIKALNCGYLKAGGIQTTFAF